MAVDHMKLSFMELMTMKEYHPVLEFTSGFQLCYIGAITVHFIMTVASVLFQLHQ